MKTTFDRSSEVVLIYLVVISIAFIFSTQLPKGEEVILINSHYNNELDGFFKFITNLGDGIIFLPVIVFLLFQCYREAILGVFVWALHGLICLISKRWLFAGMKRPAAVLDNSLLHFVEGVNVHHNFSFPSGHTATIFCLAVFISLVARNRLLSLLLLITAVCVAYSRIYLLQHFLEDIIAGSLIGTLTSYIAYTYFTAAKFPPWMSSNMKTLFLRKELKPRYNRS